MTEDWSCLSQQDTDPYAQICKEAVEDDDKFKIFKKDPRYTAILEHVPYEPVSYTHLTLPTRLPV